MTFRRLLTSLRKDAKRIWWICCVENDHEVRIFGDGLLLLRFLPLRGKGRITANCTQHGGVGSSCRSFVGMNEADKVSYEDIAAAMTKLADANSVEVLHKRMESLV